MGRRTVCFTNLRIPLVASLLEKSLPVRQIGEMSQEGAFEGPQPVELDDSSHNEEADETAGEEDDGDRDPSNALHLLVLVLFGVSLCEIR